MACFEPKFLQEDEIEISDVDSKGYSMAFLTRLSSITKLKWRIPYNRTIGYFWSYGVIWCFSKLSGYRRMLVWNENFESSATLTNFPPK